MTETVSFRARLSPATQRLLTAQDSTYCSTAIWYCQLASTLKVKDEYNLWEPEHLNVRYITKFPQSTQLLEVLTRALRGSFFEQPHRTDHLRTAERNLMFGSKPHTAPQTTSFGIKVLTTATALR